MGEVHSTWGKQELPWKNFERRGKIHYHRGKISDIVGKSKISWKCKTFVWEKRTHCWSNEATVGDVNTFLGRVTLSWGNTMEQ